MDLSDRLKKLRHDRGLYQSDVAEKIGVSTAMISSYESGNKKPQIDKLNKLAAFYGVSVDYLLGQSEYSTENQELDKWFEDNDVRMIARKMSHMTPDDKVRLKEMVKLLFPDID